jgi:hypothetical protein
VPQRFAVLQDFETRSLYRGGKGQEGTGEERYTLRVTVSN